jgi:ABC-type glycerol-3-phosphate transport system permease component
MKFFIVYIAAVFLLPFNVSAQVSVDTGKQIITPFDPVAMQQKMDEYINKEKKDTAAVAKIMLPLFSADTRLDSQQLLAWQNYYAYMTQGYKHRKNVFAWQLVSSKIIFFMVIFLVLMGIYFAWLQFMHVIRKGNGQKLLHKNYKLN